MIEEEVVVVEGMGKETIAVEEEEDQIVEVLVGDQKEESEMKEKESATKK